MNDKSINSESTLDEYPLYPKTSQAILLQMQEDRHKAMQDRKSFEEYKRRKRLEKEQLQADLARIEAANLSKEPVKSPVLPDTKTKLEEITHADLNVTINSS